MTRDLLDPLDQLDQVENKVIQAGQVTKERWALKVTLEHLVVLAHLVTPVPWVTLVLRDLLDL